MTNISQDKIVGNEIGSPQDEAKPGVDISDRTPNLRKRLRNIAIAAALPLLSLVSMPQIADAMIPLDNGESPNTPMHQLADEPNPGPPRDVLKSESLQAYLYEKAKDNLTYGLPIPAGGENPYNPEIVFQYELGNYLAPEKFKDYSVEDLPELILQMKEKIDEMSKVVIENYREGNPGFYDQLHDDYIKTYDTFNGTMPRGPYDQISESNPKPAEVSVPRVGELMAEMRLNEMLGNVIAK